MTPFYRVFNLLKMHLTLRDLMKFISKLAFVSFVALGLSSCSFTQGVAQAAYNNKAESDCQSQFGDSNSIHNNVKSSCNGQYFDPNASSWDPNAILKLESDKGIDVEDVTPSE